jgi:hypothetical protein
MFTIRNIGGVALFLFGTTFLWLTPEFATRGIPTSGAWWSITRILALVTLLGFAVATWGLFRQAAWWDSLAIAAAILGMVTLVPYWLAAQPSGDPGRWMNALVHILGSHPTPPAFDGPERRNVLRNHDEIRFWADYITPGRAADYIYDDDGGRGGLRPGARFVIAGDLNADPCDGDSVPGAIQQLLDHPLVAEEPIPDSEGAVEQTLLQGGINLEHCNPPEHDTADFSPAVGNLRVDYVLPRTGMRVTDAAVFWPTTDSPLFHRLVGTFPFPGSDHRLVYIDVRLPVGGPR